MSRFRRLSHTLWHCQYHVVWVPKYRYRILTGSVRQAAEDWVQAICGYAGCEVVELNVQPDHVHLVLMIPPKVAVSDLLGRLKGQTSIKMFHQFRYLKKKPYWGNHFWTKGYCVDTVSNGRCHISIFDFKLIGTAKKSKIKMCLRIVFLQGNSTAKPPALPGRMAKAML